MKRSRLFWIPAFAGMTLCMSSIIYSSSLSDLDSDKLISGGMKLTKATAGMSDEEEIKIGREVAAYLAARYGVVNDAAQTKYVNLVGRLVARQSARNNIPYHFGILKSDEINAWAAPGGYIFVTEALLKFLENEAELAGALAHEVSHVSERHIVKAMRKADLLGAGQDLVSSTHLGTESYATLSNFSIDFLNKGFSRDDELAADGLGAVTAAKAGYDPQAYRYSLKRIAWKNDPKETLFSQYHKMHPPIEARLKSIDRSLKKEGNLTEGQKVEARFQQTFKTH